MAKQNNTIFWIIGITIILVIAIFISNYQVPLIKERIDTSKPIGLIIHYYDKYGNEINPEKTIFSIVDGLPDVYFIAFSISATNTGEVGLKNFKIVDASPQAFKDALPIVGEILSTSAGSTENFEDVTFPPTGWTTLLNANWFRDTTHIIDGAASAGSGDIIDSQTSWLKYSLTFQNDGWVIWDWKVSSEKGFDYLVFCIDKDPCNRVSYDERICSSTSGTWTTSVLVNKSVLAGSHTFTWAFSKDGSVSSGDDMGVIDNIQFSEGGSGAPITLDIGNSDILTTSSRMGTEQFENMTQPVNFWAKLSAEGVIISLITYAEDNYSIGIIPDCQPETCASLGKQCGSWPDGCGGTIDCGICSEGYICDNGICKLFGFNITIQ